MLYEGWSKVSLIYMDVQRDFRRVVLGQHFVFMAALEKWS